MNTCYRSWLRRGARKKTVFSHILVEPLSGGADFSAFSYKGVLRESYILAGQIWQNLAQIPP
jgi:hypothetical protein